MTSTLPLRATALSVVGLLFAVVAASAQPENAPSESRPQTETVEPKKSPSDSPKHSSQLRLDEITIEGEVDVPRVLFIESRDRLRRAEFLHRLFLRDVTELGRDAPLGHGISWTPNGPNEDQRGVVPSWTP